MPFRIALPLRLHPSYSTVFSLVFAILFIVIPAHAQVKEVARFELTWTWVEHLSLSADGNIVAAAIGLRSREGTPPGVVRIYDALSGKLKLDLPLPRHAVDISAMSVSPNGQRLGVLTSTNKNGTWLGVHDLRDGTGGKELVSLDRDVNYAMRASRLPFSPDSKELAVTANVRDDKARFRVYSVLRLDADSGRELGRYDGGGPNDVDGLVYSDDGKLFTTRAEDNKSNIGVYRRDNQKMVAQMPLAMSENPPSLPVGKWITDKGPLRFTVNWHEGHLSRDGKILRAAVTSALFKDGRKTGETDMTLLLELRAGGAWRLIRLKQTLNEGNEYPRLIAAQFSPSGKRMAGIIARSLAPLKPGVVHVWNTENGELLTTIGGVGLLAEGIVAMQWISDDTLRVARLEPRGEPISERSYKSGATNPRDLTARLREKEHLRTLVLEDATVAAAAKTPPRRP